MHQRKGAYFKSKNLTHILNRFIRILTLFREKKNNSRNINVWDAGHSHPIFMRGIPVQTKTMRFLANQTCVRNPDQRAQNHSLCNAFNERTYFIFRRERMGSKRRRVYVLPSHLARFADHFFVALVGSFCGIIFRPRWEHVHRLSFVGVGG